MTPAEEQGRRWLVGFPRHLRAARGEEVLGVVLDLCPPGIDHLPLARRLELLRVGLRARRREVPPPSVWWGVLNATPRSRHGMVPDRWRPWLVRRLATTSFLWTWAVLRILLCVLPLATLQVWLAIDDRTNVAMVGLAWAAMVGVLAALSVPISGGRWRQTLRRRNGLDAHGTPLADDEVQVVARGATFRNVSVRGPLALLTLVLGGRTVAEVDRLAVPVTAADLRSPLLLAVALGVPAGLACWSRWEIDRSVAAYAWAPMARGRTVRAVAGEAGVLVLAAFLASQGAVALGDATTPATGSLALTLGLAAVLAVVVVRGRRDRPVGLWDLVPSAGPLLQREPLRPSAPTPYRERHPRRRPPAVG